MGGGGAGGLFTFPRSTDHYLNFVFYKTDCLKHFDRFNFLLEIKLKIFYSFIFNYKIRISLSIIH